MTVLSNMCKFNGNDFVNSWDKIQISLEIVVKNNL